jgi:carbon starvation protein
VLSGTADAPALSSLLFPFLFVTIACGACSGFHGLVCGGTTSKQIARESHCRPVGYGAMLCETFVALVALVTIMIVSPSVKAPAGAIYGRGIGEFVSVVVGRDHLLFATVFGSMAFSTFIFDTLDVATRLGRYIIQELFDWRGHVSAVAGTFATVAIPLLFIVTAEPPMPGKPPADMACWTLFGTSNQLLAALTLIGVTVWLKRTGRPSWFTWAPTVLLLTMTVWALILQAHTGFTTFRGADGSVNATLLMNGVVAIALLGLATFVVLEAIRAVRMPRVPDVPELAA